MTETEQDHPWSLLWKCADCATPLILADGDWICPRCNLPGEAQQEQQRCPSCDEDDAHCICDQRLSEEEYQVLTWEAPSIPYPIDTIAEYNKIDWATF